MRRTFGFDVLACPQCGGRLRLLALIEHRAAVERILRHLGLPIDQPEPCSARAPLGRADARERAWDEGAATADVTFCRRSAGRVSIRGSRFGASGSEAASPLTRRTSRANMSVALAVIRAVVEGDWRLSPTDIMLRRRPDRRTERPLIPAIVLVILESTTYCTARASTVVPVSSTRVAEMVKTVFDYERLVSSRALIVDTRNALKGRQESAVFRL